MPRAHRKDEHIKISISNPPKRADFSDISFIHNCLPDKNFSNINLKAEYLGRTHRSPLFINSVTGGTKRSLKINAALAAVARHCGLPMAVGSQMTAIEDSSSEASFKVVRRINPRGVIWANIGSYADPEMVIRAIKMIKADGIQIHLNAAQELVMREGDLKFEGMVNRISDIVKKVNVPVIVKEVGFGMAREQAEILIKAGVAAIDVGGKGGTNFLAIENRRSGGQVSADFCSWGIPTAISLVEVASAAQGKIDVFSSGGMHAPLDIARAIALGAGAVGMAGYPLYHLYRKGPIALVKRMRKIENELRLILILTGAQKVADLQKIPLVITGYTAEWMQRRGLKPDNFARRPAILYDKDQRI